MGIFVTKDEVSERLDICKKCEEFKSIKVCGICNCYMPVKVVFAAASCPKEKWKISNSSEDEGPREHLSEA